MGCPLIGVQCAAMITSEFNVITWHFQQPEWIRSLAESNGSGGPEFRSAIGGKTSKTAVLPGFCKIKCGGGGDGAATVL